MSNLSTCLQAFVTELLNGGVKHVVINPGSRNFPLIKTFTAANKFVQLHSCVDERSAGFMALGLAQGSDSPVVLCCTSGSAGLNYYPAIAEAFYSETSLVILTADRPPESIDNWEGQCIRQTHVFDKHVHESFETPVDTQNTTLFKQIGHASVKQSITTQGPVHVNMPFREPFYADWSIQEFPVVPNGLLKNEPEAVPTDLISAIQQSKNILWVNGASMTKVSYDYPKNLVVFSDVISNKNEGISNWETVLMTRAIKDESLFPDLLITTGKYMVSKQLRAFLKTVNHLPHWHITRQKQVPSPFYTKPTTIDCEVNEVLRAIESNYKTDDYKSRFDLLSKRIQLATEGLDWSNDSEFSAMRAAYNAVPDGSILHVSNSMPIRYVGLLPKRSSIKHLANRGTSGIDGCTSTAVGFAKTTKKPVYLFTGDLAFLYDINGLWQEAFPPNLKIIVFNNHGGGIFELIDGPNKHEDTIAWQTTNHKLDVSQLANHFKIAYLKTTTYQELETGLNQFHASKEPVILEVQSDRSLNNLFYQDYKKTSESALHDIG